MSQAQKDDLQLLQGEVERLKKLTSGSHAEQIDQGQANNVTFRKLMRAVSMAKMLIEKQSSSQAQTGAE
jgi:hypothetical protein